MLSWIWLTELTQFSFTVWFKWPLISIVLSISRSGDERGGERISVILGEGCYWGLDCSLGVHPSMCICMFICAFGYALAMNYNVQTCAEWCQGTHRHTLKQLRQAAGAYRAHSVHVLFLWALTAITVKQNLRNQSIYPAVVKDQKQRSSSTSATKPHYQQLPSLWNTYTQYFCVVHMHTNLTK